MKIKKVIKPSIILAITLAVGLLSDKAIAQDKAKLMDSKLDTSKQVQQITVRPEVTTPHNRATSLSEVGSSITTINKEEFINSSDNSLINILRGIDGVDVVRTGGPGGNTSIFIRGTNSEHTLVLIDGVEANNPASPAGAFNLTNMTLDNVERIEILKGPQSLIYGSNAIGGVINIITKKGQGKSTLGANLQAGTYQSGRISFDGAWGNSRNFFTVAGSLTSTEGVSSSRFRDGNREEDGYKNGVFSINAGKEITENHQIEFTTRQTRSESELDNFTGPGGDDPNRELTATTSLFGLKLSSDFFDSKLEQTIYLNHAIHRLKDINSVDTANPVDELFSRFNGRRSKAGIVELLSPTDYFELSIGGEYEEERARSTFQSNSSFGEFNDETSPENIYNGAAFAETRFLLGEYGAISAGIRTDNNNRFGERTTWRTSASVNIPDTSIRLHSSLATGFKAPTVNQLFSSFGNIDLNPETSKSFDIGFEFALDKTVTFDTTFFRNDINNLITFNPQDFILENIDSAKSNGVEVAVNITPTENTRWRNSYTYQDTQNNSTGQSLLRRPRNKLRSALYYNLGELNLSVDAVWNGARYDNDFSQFEPELVKLGSYTLYGAHVEYNLNENVTLTADVDNIFDKEYEEAFGFGALGTTGFIGIRFNG